MKKRVLFNTLVLFALFAGLQACGKKGPPLPPFSLIPDEATDMRAEGKEGGIMVSWRMPDKNEDGSPLADLAGFKLFRRVSGEGCKTCPADFPVYIDIDIEAPGGARIEGRKVYFRDQEIEPAKTYHYKVAPYNRRGQLGNSTETVSAFWQEPPPPPTGLHGTVSDGAAMLKWEPYPGKEEENFAGYNLYRGTLSDTYPLKPAGTLLEGETFDDKGLENNRPYYYVVRNVLTSGETLIEGPSSREIMLIPIDLTPPPPPGDLSAVPTGKGVRLFWKGAVASDLLGYHVYRKVEGEVALEKITASPTDKSYYLDEMAKAGETYLYSVTSVDNSPQKNESEPSEEMTVRVPK